MKIIYKKTFGIVLIYFLVGCLWIVFTDQIIEYFVSDMHMLTKFQTYKGWFYIFGTTLLLYLLIKQQLGKISAFNQELEKSNTSKTELLSKLNQAQKTAKIGSWDWNIAANQVWWSDEMFTIFEVNRLTYEPSAESLGLFISSAEKVAFEKSIQGILSDNSILNIDLRIITPKGTIKYCNFICWTEQDDIGLAQSVKGTVMDITDRKNVEQALIESEEKYRAFFDNSLDAAFFTSLDGSILSANPAAYDMLGYNNKELETLVRSNLIDISEHGFQQYLIESEKNNTFRGELTFIRKNGERFPVEISSCIFMDAGNQKRASMIIRDISARKLAEQEIKKLNEQLEEKVIRRTNQLQAVIKELESFSYTVSHDLRAPLRALDGFANILLQDYSATLDSEANRLLRIIIDNANKMGHLIDVLLSFSRLGRQDIHKETIDMQKMMKSVCNEIITEQEIINSDVSIKNLANATGDPALIRQVCVNLVSNALKYSSKKTRRIIEIGSKKVENENVFFVKDNGAGFDMEYYNKLFGVFQRLHSVRDFEGTGIGLAIVQRIVSRHGGRVWAEGKVDEGAIFYFTLNAVKQDNSNPDHRLR